LAAPTLPLTALLETLQPRTPGWIWILGACFISALFWTFLVLFARYLWRRLHTEGAAPNGGPATRLGNSGVTGGAAIGELIVSQNQTMRYQVEIADSEPTLTAVLRDRVPSRELPKFVPAACGEVWSFVRSAGLRRPGRHVSVYLDAQGSVEVGVEVSEEFAASPRVHCSRLPAGRVAHTTHFGPYGRLSEAHAAIRTWCAEQGYRCTGISWELYGHWEESWNADSSKIRTDVFYLLDEKKG